MLLGQQAQPVSRTRFDAFHTAPSPEILVSVLQEICLDVKCNLSMLASNYSSPKEQSP